MKRILSLIMAVVIVASCMVTPAFAVEPASAVIVEYGNEEIIIAHSDAVDNATPMVTRARQVIDLGTDGYISMTINNFNAGATHKTMFDYRTNSTKIKITMKSDIAVIVRVTLYDASTNSAINQTTVNVGTVSNTYVSFTNLIASKTYYIKYENVSQQNVNVSGRISAK